MTCEDEPETPGVTFRGAQADMCERCPNEPLCPQDGRVLQNCAIRAHLPGVCASLDDRANVDPAFKLFGVPLPATCAPFPYDCISEVS